MLGGVVESMVVGEGDRLLQREQACPPSSRGKYRREQPVRERVPILEHDTVLPQPQPDVVLHVEGAMLAWDRGKRSIEEAFDPVVSVGHDNPDGPRGPDGIMQTEPRLGDRGTHQLDLRFRPAPGDVPTEHTTCDVHLDPTS